jgi:hypothetical protein
MIEFSNVVEIVAQMTDNPILKTVNWLLAAMIALDNKL